MADHNVRGDLRVRGSITVDGAGGSGLGGEYLHVRNEQLAGTNGGGVTAATWSTGVLNTIVTNTLTGASLSSNQITLPAGDYYTVLTSHHHPHTAVGPDFLGVQVRLRNITDAETIFQGLNGRLGVDLLQSDYVSRGRFSLTASKDIELQYIHSITVNAGNEQGVEAGNSLTEVGTEVYASVEIWKI